MQGRTDREERFGDPYPKLRGRAKREERFRERERERVKYSILGLQLMNSNL